MLFDCLLQRPPGIQHETPAKAPNHRVMLWGYPVLLSLVGGLEHEFYDFPYIYILGIINHYSLYIPILSQ
jgi:hypothetical protein